MNEQKTASAWLPIMIIFAISFWAFFALLVFYANGLRVDNIAKNKEVAELRGYKQAWIDFNKSYIPATALPRIPKIEAIYEDNKK